MASEPVVHVEADSTHVNRVPVRIAPAYALAVEPRQAVEVLAGEHKAFHVFLRSAFVFDEGGECCCRTGCADGWKSSGAEELSFTGEGDRYAKITLIPRGTWRRGITQLRHLRNAAGRNSLLRWSRWSRCRRWFGKSRAQTVVHAFDIRVPENLRVGYISAESEPVPDALKMLGIRVEMLDANTLILATFPNTTRLSWVCALTNCAANCQARISGCWITRKMAEHLSCSTSGISRGTARTTRHSGENRKQAGRSAPAHHG